MKPEEAIDILGNLKVCKQAHTLFNIEKEAVDMAIEALKEIRPKGKWEGHVERRNLNTRKCTSCGEYGAVGHFCMWCGADMMREGDEK